MATYWAAVRALLAFTVLLGLAYPLAVTGVAQLPGLQSRAEGSLVTNAAGEVVGSRLIGQSFTGSQRYFQSRPSAAGDGYDPTSTGASNRGPEDVVDADPEAPSLLTQVCARSAEVGDREGVDGGRPYCTTGGVGAVLAVFPDRAVSVNEWGAGTPFLATYQGLPVHRRQAGEDVTGGRIVPVRGAAPADPAVPADAVTASGSGLDPHISPAYAELQVARVARERNLPVERVRQLIQDNTDGRTLGFLGEPGVDVLALNLALDKE